MGKLTKQQYAEIYKTSQELRESLDKVVDDVARGLTPHWTDMARLSTTGSYLVNRIEEITGTVLIGEVED